MFILYIHWRESSECLSPAQWQMSAKCNLCLCVRVQVRASTSRPKHLKLVKPPGAFHVPVVGPGIWPRRQFLSPPTDVVFPPPLLPATQFNKSAGRPPGVAANTSRGTGEVEVVGAAHHSAVCLHSARRGPGGISPHVADVGAMATLKY